MPESQAVVGDMQEAEAVIADGYYREGFHPWRRYFARVLDNLVNTIAFYVLVMLALAFTWFVAFVTWLGMKKNIDGGNPFPENALVRAFDAEGRELHALPSGKDFKSSKRTLVPGRDRARGSECSEGEPVSSGRI